MTAPLDTEYRSKIEQAMLQAVLAASKRDNVIALRTGEIVDAAMTLIAYMLASSPSSEPPAKLRQHTEAIAERIRKRTLLMREEIKKGGHPIPVIDPDYLDPKGGNA